MNIHISETALGNMRSIREYYKDVSPAYAKHIIKAIYRRFEQIGRFPESGSVVEEISLRQIRQVFEGRCRIIYRIAPHEIEILAVRHGAQDWPQN